MLQQRPYSNATGSIALTCAGAAAFFATAAISMATFGINTPIWFASALGVAWLMQLDQRERLYSLGLIYVVDTAAIWIAGSGPAPILALADVGEIFAMTYIITRVGGSEAALSSPTALLKFIGACLVVPLFSSTWGGTVLVLSGGGDLMVEVAHWYGSTSLGLLVVCPILLVWFTPALRSSGGTINRGELVLLLVGLAAMSVFVTSWNKPAYLFAAFPALLMLVWRGGLIGASTGSAVLVAVGLWRTLSGDVAFAALTYPSTQVHDQIAALQIYLGALTLSSLPLAVVLTDQRRLAAELIRVADARQEFLAAMSHEIRTPMTGVLGIVDLLESEPLTEPQHAYLRSIRASGRHLLDIINDILDFSRIETGKIQLEQTDFSLAALVDGLRSLLMPLAQERGIALLVESGPGSPPILRGDATRLRQVLINLTGNAIKFTPTGSVTLAVSSREDEVGLKVRFEVRDTGIGIPPEQRAHIFAPFTQADRSTNREYGGSGLGLAIVQRLVDVMGGVIGVESELGLGSLFWIELPFEPGDPVNLPASQPAGARIITPRRILLAEDVPLNRDIVRSILERDGHHVTTAVNGQEAVDHVSREQFDLVLMDVHMPVMDGMEATRRIRMFNGPAGETPIVALTANVMAAEQDKCLQAGMNEVLMKPVEWDRARATIQRFGGRNDVAADGPLPPDPSDGLPRLDESILTEIRTLLAPKRLARHVSALAAEVKSLAAMSATDSRGPIQARAHRLVSQAGMIGLTRLSARSADVEHACRNGLPLEPALKAFRQAAPDVALARRPRLNSRLG